jgi:hypothetical protein
LNVIGAHMGDAEMIVKAFEAYETAAKICPQYTALFLKGADLLRSIGQEEAGKILNNVKQMTADLVS